MGGWVCLCAAGVVGGGGYWTLVEFNVKILMRISKVGVVDDCGRLAGPLTEPQ